MLSPRPVSSAPHRENPGEALGVGSGLREDERLIVLDDDPTGSQAVHGVQVVATIDFATVDAALRDSKTVFFLTNARAMTATNASNAIIEMVRVARAACAARGLQPRFASRSDSTLRGHFPEDVDAIARGAELDATILFVPCFVEGGRWSFEDVHWVRDGDTLVPVGDTPYAKDSSFGFASSRLVDWVREKAPGRFADDNVVSMPLEMLREGDPSRISAQILEHPGGVVIANAMDYEDLRALADGVQRAERNGAVVIYRTGASFVRARAGIAPRGFLTGVDIGLRSRGRGGLIVCGSHVPLSTAQIDSLLSRPDSDGVLIDVPRLLASPASAHAVLEEAAVDIRKIVRRGHHAVAYTSREVVIAPQGEDPLALGAIVSAALVSLVKEVRDEPDFLLSKGGITSHEIATQSLELRRGSVLGQIVPGVSVWRIDEGATPGQVSIIFPGNVGERDSLSRVVAAMTSHSG